MEPAESEYLAEREFISIIPKFNDHRIIHLISGDIGPFRAGIPVAVPIWVALNLRQKQKCTIVQPDWMDVQVLEEKLEEEKSSRLFTKMPSEYYMEISHLLLSAASEDIRHSNRIRTAIKDLWEYRISKARASADIFMKSEGRHAGIDHLTQFEIGTLRPLLTDGLDAVFVLSPSTRDLQSSGSQSMFSTTINSQTLNNSFSRI